MFPSEMVILMAIEVAGDSVKRLLKRPRDVSGQYIAYLYESLVKRGYLVGNRDKGYKLTAMGREALSGFLHENEPRVKNLVRTLRQLGIDTGEEIEQMEEEAVRIR